MIGFLFIILIFVFQNITQEHNPDLSKEIYKDTYLVTIFAVLLLITMFNLSGLYFQWGYLLQSVGYILTACSFLYLIPLSLITGHYLNVSNTIRKSEQRIKSKITTDNIYRPSGFGGVPLKNEEFQEELTQDTLLITNTAIQAIENNNHVLVITCIESLEHIGQTYLDLLVSPVEDDFVRELNDQYEFIIQSTGRDYTSQKYLGPLCESIGNLSRSTFRNTENATQTSLWLQSLREIFEITYPEMDRTEALGISIREINRTVILALETETQTGGSHYWQYSSYLERIGKYCLKNGADTPLRICLSQFKWHYISMINGLVSERLYYQSHEMDKPFEEILELYSAAWQSDYFDKRFLESVFFNPVNSFPKLFRFYGLYSLTPNQAAAMGSVTASPPEEFHIEPRKEIDFENPRLESEFIESCELIVDFVGDIAGHCPGTNYHDAYSAYPELFFVFSVDVQTDFADKTVLNDELSSDFYKYMLQEISNSKHNKPDMTVVENAGDFLLITIYLNRENDDRLYDLLEYLVDFYQKAKDRVGEEDTRWIYKHLKLAGYVIDQCDGLDKSQRLVEAHLICDFYEVPDYPGKAIRPRHQRLGYPTGRGHSIKKLSSNNIWNPLYQAFEADFYNEGMDPFARYHYNLKFRSGLQKAARLQSVLSSQP
jgi:hypothetical protein